MAARKILTAENPVLRQKSKRVGKMDRSLSRLIEDMFETMYEANGLGLAAIQIGVPLRLVVIQLPEGLEDEPMSGKRLVLRNPEIIKTSGECLVEEGCLSLPGYVADVSRSEQVTVRARDEHGKEVRVRASGLLAQALQHEIDHLEGILFIDYLKSLDELRPVRRKAEGPEEESGVLREPSVTAEE
ncbi:MAG: peptide deformylase [Chloroflexi bacterium]|nr:peptide deformylase [Chloroflexota bacterium]